MAEEEDLEALLSRDNAIQDAAAFTENLSEELAHLDQVYFPHSLSLSLSIYIYTITLSLSLNIYIYIYTITLSLLCAGQYQGPYGVRGGHI